MKILVYSPRRFENVCVIGRTLEVLGIPECHVYDPNGIVRDRYGRSYNRKIKASSAGAFHKINWRIVDDPLAFVNAFPGRTVAAVPDQDVHSLHQFSFSIRDLLVFGSESQGLPDEIRAACTISVTIPQAGDTESLNVSVATGIFLGEWSRQKSLGLLLE